MLNCVHNTVRAGQCQSPAYNRKTNGWLCFEHYRQQQESVPVKPRKAQPVWKGLTPQGDADVIVDIIFSDIKAIANGRIVVVKKGTYDPVFFRTLEPAAIQ